MQQERDEWIAITGCNGYIGGQTVLEFKRLGYKILGIDRNQSTGSWLKEHIDSFIPGDYVNGMFLHQLRQLKPVAFIHVAGESLVGPSVLDPSKYYINNVGGTSKLLSALNTIGFKGTFVFSSSAAVYSDTDPKQNQSIRETFETIPPSPYGMSKLMAEKVIEDCAKAYGFNAIALRYFNACGADKEVRHGQVKSATHLIAKVMNALINKEVFTLNGIDYDTPDGTCVRDYLHVEDIARAHRVAYELGKTFKPGQFDYFNLGTGKGYSIKEIISTIERHTNKKLLVHKGPRRPGDPGRLVASSKKIESTAGWKADNSSLDNIIRTSWAWYNSQRFKDYA